MASGSPDLRWLSQAVIACRGACSGEALSRVLAALLAKLTDKVNMLYYYCMYIMVESSRANTAKQEKNVRYHGCTLGGRGHEVVCKHVRVARVKVENTK